MIVEVDTDGLEELEEDEIVVVVADEDEIMIPLPPLLLQYSDPTWTVFVDRKLGEELVKGRPAVPVRLS